MPDRSVPPDRFPLWGWILLLLAAAMLVGLLVVVFRDHQQARRTGRGPGDRPPVVAVAPMRAVPATVVGVAVVPTIVAAG
ncbi:MAG TPA: hypothetical protein VFS08_16540 [Gemmatimonadaceae bacterium]|nr:hypothetical protein [Gemmatimonadaceae bacterium]